ncbi:MAG: rhodanese-like domain-containing protein [Leptospiraceae bacterium]|nr:rhodanese-like domain-containing protein [Leptospiraceae bacterium]
MNWSFLKSEILQGDFLIDCRAQNLYEEGAPPNAFYFPFIKKAFGTDPESLKKMLGALKGIMELSSGNSRILVYDEGMGMYATRMLYLLRAVNLTEVFLYSGDLSQQKLKPGKEIVEFEPTDKLKFNSYVCDKSFLEKNLTRLQIFDTRTKEEYDGKLPRMTQPEPGTLCGRLPGAFLWDWRAFYDGEGNIIDRAVFTKRLQGFPFMPERTTVLYDYNGARSCLPALMLKEVGYQDVRTYQGSWFEWRKSSLPKQAVSLYGQEAKTASAPRVGGKDRKSV